VTVKELLCGVQERKHDSCGLSLKEPDFKTDLQASSNTPAQSRSPTGIPVSQGLEEPIRSATNE
jgi:hypothetical protein